MFKLFRRINKDKIELIDRAFSTLRIQSFADLGGVWRVEGAYTFHALENYKIKSATLADLHLTAKVTDRAKLYPQLRLIQGNFGSEAVVEQIGGVDAILLFDVLLHQVLPDWDAVLESYANKVDTMLIYNQQWMGSDTTVRLLDLGEKEYLRNVPSGHDEYNGLFKSSTRSILNTTGRGATIKVSGNGVLLTLPLNRSSPISGTSWYTKRLRQVRSATELR